MASYHVLLGEFPTIFYTGVAVPGNSPLLLIIMILYRYSRAYVEDDAGILYSKASVVQ